MGDLPYSEEIEYLASNHIDREFFNASDEHAQIVLTSMVRHTKEDLKIYCGNLCTDVSNDIVYLEEIQNFLSDRKGTMEILLCDYQDGFKSKPIYQLLSQYPSNQVKIKTTKTLLFFNNKPIHFTVADKESFRIETDIEKKMARGNFNDPESGKMLSKKFDLLFQTATLI
jgi:hypothetical protein